MTPLACLYADANKNRPLMHTKTPALIIAISAGVTICAAGVTARSPG